MSYKKTFFCRKNEISLVPSPDIRCYRNSFLDYTNSFLDSIGIFINSYKNSFKNSYQNSNYKHPKIRYKRFLIGFFASTNISLTGTCIGGELGIDSPGIGECFYFYSQINMYQYTALFQVVVQDM